ncbi:transglycosylase SLT domain-containing protein [Streptomyces luteireticuli]|uniref:Transglycosylase SLT domain-containing protein n=1 Tax=Streptomyces luteireticuli TaxID=173858 RepID=A0ABN0YX73_9ACTN
MRSFGIRPARPGFRACAATGITAAAAALTLALAPGASAAAQQPAVPASATTLSGWIDQALGVMKAKGIPGSHDGIERNVLRESSGNPQAVNTWDSNAQAGTPSKGLLQVIDPTFKTFHVDGTSWDIFDPVANITAACNYAAKTYGSIDNVDSAY